jgi:hypothetical protein
MRFEIPNDDPTRFDILTTAIDTQMAALARE